MAKVSFSVFTCSLQSASSDSLALQAKKTMHVGYHPPKPCILSSAESMHGPIWLSWLVSGTGRGAIVDSARVLTVPLLQCGLLSCHSSQQGTPYHRLPVARLATRTPCHLGWSAQRAGPSQRLRPGTQACVITELAGRLQDGATSKLCGHCSPT